MSILSELLNGQTFLAIRTAINANFTALNNDKVEKVTGKGLSENDFTDADVAKLAGIASGATANATDAQLRDRSTHTGTQLASTISDFTTAAQTAAPAETTTTLGALVNASGAATPNDSDFVLTALSAGVSKKITWTNVKAFFKTYFDTLYLGITATAANSSKVGWITVTGTPSVGQVPTATSSSAATWQTPAGGGGGLSIVGEYSTYGVPVAWTVFEKSGRAFTVTSVMISLVALPVGGNFEVNVKKNGTTILSGNLVITTTESASNSLYVVQTWDASKATVATTDFASKDRLTVEIVAGSGNTFLGAGANVQVFGTIS